MALYKKERTCGCHNATFLSAPYARRPDTSQSAVDGCLLAPAARYLVVESIFFGHQDSSGSAWLNRETEADSAK